MVHLPYLQSTWNFHLLEFMPPLYLMCFFSVKEVNSPSPLKVDTHFLHVSMHATFEWISFENFKVNLPKPRHFFILWFWRHIIPKELYQIEYASTNCCISSWEISKVMLSSLIGCHLTFQIDVWLMMTLFGKLCSNFSNGHKFNKFSFVKE